jgi:hypothetical protein
LGDGQSRDERKSLDRNVQGKRGEARKKRFTASWGRMLKDIYSVPVTTMRRHRIVIGEF